MSEKLVSAPMTPREYFETVVEQSETPNAAFVALEQNQDVGTAYNFIKGYMEFLAEYDGESGSDPYQTAEGNIRTAAAHCISGVEKDGKTPAQQFVEVLGVWPQVFSAVRIENEARAALQQQ